jgi:hypothetical protein
MRLLRQNHTCPGGRCQGERLEATDEVLVGLLRAQYDETAEVVFAQVLMIF